MNTSPHISSGPVCHVCEQPMQWVSQQMAGTQPMQVYHCELCDKYAAALPTGINGAKPAGINGAKTDSAPSLATGP